MKLNEQEVKDILDETLKSEITSYNPMKMALSKSFVVSDRATTVIGVKLKHLGSDVQYVQEVSIYGLEVLMRKFPEIEIFKKLLHLARFLEEYKHPTAEDYRPEVAELSIVEMPLERMAETLRKDVITHWDRLPKWDVRGVKLDKTEKQGRHNILELKGKKIDDVLKVLNIEDQPRMHKYKGKLYYVQFRPAFPNFPRDRTYLPFPEMIQPDGKIRLSP